jgi:hypothetical protein
MDDGTAPQGATSSKSLLVDWANQQDHWVRGIVAEVVRTGQPLAEARVAHYYDFLLREKQLSSEPFTPVAALGTVAQATRREEPLVLTSLKDVRGVNALASDQEIAFNPRLTVLFGENATGKTGYVRILKRIAQVRTAEPILPNIDPGQSPTKPHATISFRIGTTDQSVEWNDESGVHPFTLIDVFDARGAVVHVDEELTYVYTPRELSLFLLVHQAVEAIRAKLDQARRDAQPEGNLFLPRFSRDTAVYPKIESLSASTDLADLTTLAAVTPEEEAGLAAIREKVDALRSTSAAARVQVATAERDSLQQAFTAVELLQRFDLGAYGAALATLTGAREDQTRVTQQAFAADNLPGVFGDAWRAFIQAGEVYLREVERADYPSVGGQCAYCRQPLGEAASTLIRKYREFCNNDLARTIERTQGTLTQLSAPLRGFDHARLKAEAERRLANTNDPAQRQPYESLLAFLPVAQRLLDDVRAFRAHEDTTLTGAAAEVASTLRAQVSNLNTLIADLNTQAEERRRAFEREAATLRDLEARLALRELLPAIRTYVERAKWADKAGTILGRFRGLGRSLTEASKTASESILNHDFEALFNAECKSLRAPKVTLEFPGRRGQAARRKSLTADHRLSDILSEGEQKVIALADFLAEAFLKGAAAPIVFDDPVNSLDYKVTVRY